jgi:hypothetical protein
LLDVVLNVVQKLVLVCVHLADVLFVLSLLASKVFNLLLCFLDFGLLGLYVLDGLFQLLLGVFEVVFSS